MFLRLIFVVHFVAINDTSYSKRNMPARNTLVQLLAVYTNLESHNAQRHRQTDRQTDNRMMPIADHTV